MSIDMLQEKVRKLKNPSMVDLSLPVGEIPSCLLEEEGSAATAYGRFCCELLQALHGIVPAVRIGFTAFALLGPEGVNQLCITLQKARELGYYIALEAPYVLSPMMAEATAKAVFSDEAIYPCDGLITSFYAGSDVLKPFLPYVKEGKKDIFAVVRTSNKTAPELQDLLAGNRLVHAAAADLVNRYGGDNTGKFGFARVAVVAGANSAESLKNLRTKYPRMFLLLDDMDYSGCNAKNCSFAFDKFGHGAVACAGPSITLAWKQEEGEAEDYLAAVTGAAERMKKNLTRYTTIL